MGPSSPSPSPKRKLTAATVYHRTLHVTSSAHRVTIYSANRTLPETGARVAKLEESGEALDPVTRPVEDFPLASHKDECLKDVGLTSCFLGRVGA